MVVCKFKGCKRVLKDESLLYCKRHFYVVKKRFFRKYKKYYGG